MWSNKGQKSSIYRILTEFEVLHKEIISRALLYNKAWVCTFPLKLREDILKHISYIESWFVFIIRTLIGYIVKFPPKIQKRGNLIYVYYLCPVKRENVLKKRLKNKRPVTQIKKAPKRVKTITVFLIVNVPRNGNTINTCKDAIYSVKAFKVRKMKGGEVCSNFPVRSNFPLLHFQYVLLRYPKRKTKPLFFFQSPQRKPFKTLGGGYPPLPAWIWVCSNGFCYVYWSSNFPVKHIYRITLIMGNNIRILE